MMKYTNEIETTVEQCKDGSGNWYWAITSDGELYADGEAGSRDEAENRCMVNLQEWKEYLA